MTLTKTPKTSVNVLKNKVRVIMVSKTADNILQQKDKEYGEERMRDQTYFRTNELKQ